MPPLLLLSLLAATPSGPASADAHEELWAGHAVLIGHRSVPFLGKVEARTESFVLAKVKRNGSTISFDQIACTIDLSNPTGVKLALNPDAPEKLPAVHLDFDKKSDGLWHQREASTGWDKDDVDGDGHPGMTVNVDAPICGGKLFVSLHTVSIARGTLAPEANAMNGELKAKVRQVVLDTEGACLGVLVRDSDERASGAFAYLAVNKDSTCASLKKAPWPVRATVPQAKKGG